MRRLVDSPAVLPIFDVGLTAIRDDFPISG